MKNNLRKRIGRLSEESQKKGKKQMSSLYLAYTPHPGSKFQYEWLNLQVFESPKTNIEKDHNRETMQLAESIRQNEYLTLKQQVRDLLAA